MKFKILFIMMLTIILSAGSALAAPGDENGPYSHWYGDTRPGIPDAGIAGFVGPHGDGKANLNGANPDNYVNPIFKGWATGWQNYLPSPGVDAGWQTPGEALGAVTGNNMDIVSLGDLNQTQINAWLADPTNNPGPGEITFTFANLIYNGAGADFAAFENGFEQTGSLFFAELGYVEVSTDGINFARFDSDYQAATAPVGPYGVIDSTYAYNLVGKHANAYEESWGTPFDLETLADDPLVLGGSVDLDDINYVKIIDIPGSGDFLDDNGNDIYDAWVTWGSGGVDFEALGVINAVPVPGAIWLVGSGLLALVGLRKKKVV